MVKAILISANSVGASCLLMIKSGQQHIQCKEESTFGLTIPNVGTKSTLVAPRRQETTTSG